MIELKTNKMNTQNIKERLFQLENYLNKKWNGISDNFIDRLLAKIEYEKLLKQLSEQQNGKLDNS